MHQENISNILLLIGSTAMSRLFYAWNRFKTEIIIDKNLRSDHLSLSSQRVGNTATCLCRRNRFASFATLAIKWNEATSVIAYLRRILIRLREVGYKAHILREKTVLTKAMRKKKIISARCIKIRAFRNGENLYLAMKVEFL